MGWRLIRRLGINSIVTLAGMRAWMANAALATATTEYRVYYQNNGGIYVGYVIKDGTTLPLAGGTPQDSYYFLNSAALQSSRRLLFEWVASEHGQLSARHAGRADQCKERSAGTRLFELIRSGLTSVMMPQRKRKAPTSRGFSSHQLLEARAGVEPA